MALKKSLYGLSVYVNGIDYVGVATSFTPPEVSLQTEESDMPGHAGPIDVPTGRLEALEATIKMGDAFPVLESLVGAPTAPDTPVLLVQVTTDGAARRAVEWEIAGLWKKQSSGEVGGGGSGGGECTYEISVRTLTHRIDGSEVRHIDLEQSIHRINGADVLADLRAALRRGR